jgi:MOSC domain-containing protein YiiM
MQIVSLNIGMPKEVDYNGLMVTTGIQKQTVQEAVLTTNGFQGDGVANTDFHGGPDRAVCFYPYEHYQQWENEFKVAFTPPAFGENLTVRNMHEKTHFIGDIFQIGETIVQITQPRVPCSTISWQNQNTLLLKRVVQTCFTGFLGRVLQEGMIFSDSKIKKLDEDQNKISVYKVLHTYMHDSRNKDAIENILHIDALAPAMKQMFEKKYCQLE